MKPKPTSSMQSATSPGSRSIRTPSASSSAAVVETLNVVGPPPVPAVSTRSLRSVSTGVASERMVRARPTSSGTVSPLARRAMRKAPVWTSPARPSMISASTAAAWSAVRCSPSATASIARVTTSLGAIAGHPLSEEVLQQAFPLRGQHRLGVKLHSLRRKLAVAHGHHDVAVGGAHLERLRHRVRLGDERVVAARDQRAGEAGEDRPAVVLNLGVLAVDRI